MATDTNRFVIYREATVEEYGKVLVRIAAVQVPVTSTKPHADAMRKFKSTSASVPLGDYVAIPAKEAQSFTEREDPRTSTTVSKGEVQ